MRAHKRCPQLGDEDSDEEDPFAEVDDDGFEEANLEQNIARDKQARQISLVAELVDAISDEEDEYPLREASLELVRIAWPRLKGGMA
jgi:hypothetical protein